MDARGLSRSLFLLACICLHTTQACVFKYGTAPDSLVPPHGGSHWNHALSGDDWAGEDAQGHPWVCMTGHRQSPINLPHLRVMDDAHKIPPHLRTQWFYPDLVSNGSNIEVINNGHAIQVEWLFPYKGQVKIAVPEVPTNHTKITSVLFMEPDQGAKYITATPVQFHFHTSSEHLFVGRYFPLELHIVHRVTGGIPACANGCFSVTGIVFELCLHCDDNPLLAPIWAFLPQREGQINLLPPWATISLEQLLGDPHERSYYTYEGSLTTPPCTEGLLWHVMLKPQKISSRQWRHYKRAVSFKECNLKNATSPSPSQGPEPAPTVHHRHRTNRRMLLSEEEPIGNPNDYNCTFFAYGGNFRAPQPTWNRVVKLAESPVSLHRR